MTDSERKLTPGIGLALSGGGFRAALFHIGSLWRLNELGYLPKIKRVCSVSGGSIVAALLGLRWNALEFEDGVAQNLGTKVFGPLRRFMSDTWDVPAVLQALFTRFSRGGKVMPSKFEYLYGESTLQDFPFDSEGPRFILYATNMQTSSSVRMSKPYIADYRLGMFRNPTVPLATCVAASAGFPPVLSPVTLRLDTTTGGGWENVPGAYLFHEADLRERMQLFDGGVYDNLGIEAIWDQFETVLVSDAGAPMKTQRNVRLHTLRALNIMGEQARALRLRRLISDFKAGRCKGTYWGIATEVDDYRLEDPLVRDNSTTAALKAVRTRLDAFQPWEQGELINWGYAVTDTAIRKYVEPSNVTPSWPVPEHALG